MAPLGANPASAPAPTRQTSQPTRDPAPETSQPLDPLTLPLGSPLNPSRGTGMDGRQKTKRHPRPLIDPTRAATLL
jgi:hypothetical protein